MNAYHNYRVLLVVGIIIVMGASLVYVFTLGNTSTQHTVAKPTATLEPTATIGLRPTETVEFVPKPCGLKQHTFQMGVSFPDWGTMGYGESDVKWLTELPVMQTKTAACWIEMPVLFEQATRTSTAVMAGPKTPSLSSFTYGIQRAHSLGYHIFVTPLFGVDDTEGWAGVIHFSTVEQEQQWFDSYWQALKPYALAAAQVGVEQFAIGTECVWLEQNAPSSLWNKLIAELRSVFPGKITYDMDWSSLQTHPPAWMHNSTLNAIGVSTYLPLTDTPQRVDPKQIFGLWKQRVKQAIDNFSEEVGKPMVLSEIGYPNSTDSLYHPWESHSTAPADQEEQAAAVGAALANIIPDQHVLGTFFWGWDNTGDFDLHSVQAATVILKYYKSLQA
jgi:hypothetical protein